MRFRKKPVVIDAAQFTGERPWPDGVHASTNPRERGEPICHTLEGPLRVSVGDWIIKGIKGEFYPCKPDIFAMTYEPVAPSAGDQGAPDLDTDTLTAMAEMLPAPGSTEEGTRCPECPSCEALMTCERDEGWVCWLCGIRGGTGKAGGR